METDYYEYQKKTISERINKEVKALINSPNFNYSLLHHAYVSYLISRINSEKSGNIKIKNITKLEDLKTGSSKDMEKTIYQKPWHRLRDTHKRIKFSEFVEKLKYKNPDDCAKNKQDVLKDLLFGLKEKKYGQSKVQVTYDQEKMEITDVQCLSYDKKKDIYIVTWE